MLIRSEELKGRRVLTVGEVERLAAAVQWDLGEHPDDWGPVRDGAEAWACDTGSAATLAIVGRMSSGIIEAMGRAVEELDEAERFGLIVYATKAEAEAARRDDTIEAAFRWPWDNEPGAELCRANAAVLEEAARIAPMWDQFGEAREVLKANDGAGAWDDGWDDKGRWRPAPVFRVLVGALAWAWKRRSMVPGLPVNVAAALSVSMTSPATLWTEKGKALNVDPESREMAVKALKRGSEIEALLSRGAVVPAIDGRGDWFTLQAEGWFAEVVELAGVLASHLAHAAMAQWRAGGDGSDFVFLPASRDGLRRELGRDVMPEKVKDALMWLRDVRVGPHSLVDAWDETWERPGRQRGRGRPSPYFMVKVGLALHPWLGIEACRRRGFEIPANAAFLSPILSARDAPLVGDHRTRDRQRVAFSFLLGAVFVEHREQVLDWGGIEEATLRRALRDRGGLYVRSHSDLPQRVIDKYCEKPEQLSLEGERGPVLRRFEAHGKRLLAFADGYAAEARLIIGAGKRTKFQRARQARGRVRASESD